MKNSFDLDRDMRKGPIELFVSTVLFHRLIMLPKKFFIIAGFVVFSLLICSLAPFVNIEFEDVSNLLAHILQRHHSN